MLNSIRKRLILLYTCSTGLILTAVLIFVSIILSRQLYTSKIDAFKNNYRNINQNVQMNHVISNLWMSEMEIKNHLIIQIEDNGTPFLFKGSWTPPENRLALVNKVKEMAQEDNVNTNVRPISLNEVQSRIYEVKGNNNDRYLGEVFIVPMGTGYRSAVVLQYISGDGLTVLKQRLLLVLLNLAGIASLFLVSRQMVSKSLKPVEESRKRQTEFIAAASHELKSPLAVIRANTSALIVEPDRAKHFTIGIDKECRRMAALVEDLLLLASADSGNWNMKKEVMDMDTLLIETYELFYPYCREQGKELKLLLQDEVLPKTEGDRERLKQILAILIDNAVTYSIESDTIIIRGFCKKNRLWIEVEDHGPGIAPEKKQEIFERFYRVDKSRKDKNHFGLGLSVAKELTEMQGGSIAARDTAGGGATFFIVLAVHKQ